MPDTTRFRHIAPWNHLSDNRRSRRSAGPSATRAADPQFAAELEKRGSARFVQRTPACAGLRTASSRHERVIEHTGKPPLTLKNSCRETARSSR